MYGQMHGQTDTHTSPINRFTTGIIPVVNNKLWKLVIGSMAHVHPVTQPSDAFETCCTIGKK